MGGAVPEERRTFWFGRARISWKREAVVKIANLLSPDLVIPELIHTGQKDVLKEMVNMVAGGLVNICDPEGRIVLGIPVCAEKTVSGQSLPCDNGDLNCYDSDDGFLVVCCQKKECFS